MKANSKIALFGAIGAAVLLAIRKKRSVAGIGATKRRIYKELSLAQQAGVDFTKKYDELDEDEILALERVSADTGYTETYYKSLKKAYDAISGIGETYDVVDENGNVCLSWIEDPQPAASRSGVMIDDQERADYLRYAREVEDDQIWAQQEKQREFDEREKRLAEMRKNARRRQKQPVDQDFLKRLQEARELGERMARKQSEEDQLALFGIGYVPAKAPFWYGIPSVELVWHGEWGDPEIYYRGKYYNAYQAENELYAIWRDQIEYGETDLVFDEWMQSVGGDYLKQDVLPYL